MTNFSDEDDGFLMETKDFLQRATQDSQSQPQSAEAEEPELVDVSGANTQAWLMKVRLISLERWLVRVKVWFHISIYTRHRFLIFWPSTLRAATKTEMLLALSVSSPRKDTQSYICFSNKCACVTKKKKV